LNIRVLFGILVDQKKLSKDIEQVNVVYNRLLLLVVYALYHFNSVDDCTSVLFYRPTNRCTQLFAVLKFRQIGFNELQSYAAFTPAQLVARNTQLVAGNKHHVAHRKLIVARNKLRVARNMLASSNKLRVCAQLVARNLLRWCKRGITVYI